MRLLLQPVYVTSDDATPEYIAFDEFRYLIVINNDGRTSVQQHSKEILITKFYTLPVIYLLHAMPSDKNNMRSI
jgi:hypothetical protein